MTTTTDTTAQADLDAQAYEAYQATGGNARIAADALGMARTTLNGRVKRHLARMEQDRLDEQAAETVEQAADEIALIALTAAWRRRANRKGTR